MVRVVRSSLGPGPADVTTVAPSHEGDQHNLHGPSRTSHARGEEEEQLRLYQSLWLCQMAIPFVNDATSQYDVVRQIGKGNFSTVYFARHRKYADGVAMKLIDKRRVTDSPDVRKVLRNVRRVNNEVTLIRSCTHEGICQLFDAFQTNQHVFIIMDFVDRDLFHLLSGYPDGLPERLAKSMNRTVALTICYLHDEGIAHRDIKPENILVKGSLQNDDLTVKLCDFGLSLRPEGNCTDFVGSPGFFAPEAFLERSYDAFKCDVWSFGAVLLETLLGTRTFDRLWAHAYAVLESRRVFSEAITASIHRLNTIELLSKQQDLRKLVLGALCFDPEQRAAIATIVANQWIMAQDDVYGTSLKILRMSIDPVPELPQNDQNATFRRNELQSAACDLLPLNVPAPPTTSPGTSAAFRNRSVSLNAIANTAPSTEVRSSRAAEYTLPLMTICHLDDSNFVRRVVEARLSIAFPCHRLVNFADTTGLVQIIIASQQQRQESRINEIRVSILDEHIREDLRGSEIARMLRALNYEGLIFCMTADYENQVEEPQRAQVFDGVLSKQITPLELRRTLVETWRNKFGGDSLVHAALLSQTVQPHGEFDFKALRTRCIKQILRSARSSLTHAELIEIKGDLESVKCSASLLETLRRYATDPAVLEAGEVPFDNGSPLYIAIKAELEANIGTTE